jgi:hypothetical protein
MADNSDIKDLVDALSGRDADRAEKIFSRILETMGKIRRFAAETVEELEAQARLEAELEMHSAKYLSGIEKITRERQAQITLAEGARDSALKTLRLAKQTGKASGQALADLQKTVVEKQKELDAQKELLGLQKSAADQGNKLAQLMFGVSGSSNNILKTWKKLGTAGYARSLASGLQEALSVTNLMIAGLKKLAESTISGFQTNDAFNTSLARSVQLSEEGTDRVFKYAKNWDRFGASLDEAASYYDSVFTGIVGFTQASEAQQETLHRNAMLFAEGMGSIDSYTQAINSLSTSFVDVQGDILTMEKATSRLHTSVIGYGKAIGFSGQEAVNMFNRVSPRMAEFGVRGMQVFQDLAAQSKMTGIEIQELSSIATQFDTFQGAASAVSNLNAILGGSYLNTLDMVNASDEERVRLIQEAMQRSGRNIDNIHLQRAAAGALNTTTENAIRLLKGEAAETDNLADSGRSAADIQLDMAAAAERSTTAAERLAIAVENANAEMARPSMEAYRNSMAAAADVITTFPLPLLIGGLTAFGVLLSTIILPAFVRWTGAKLGIQTETGKLTGSIQGLEGALTQMATAIESRLVPALDRLTQDSKEAETASDGLTDAMEEQGNKADTAAGKVDELSEAQRNSATNTDGSTQSLSRWNPMGMTTAQIAGNIAMTVGTAIAAFQGFNQILDMFPQGTARAIAGSLMAIVGVIGAIHAAKAGFPLGLGVGLGIAAAAAGTIAAVKNIPIAMGLDGGEVPGGMGAIRINENAGAGRGTGGEAFIGESARRMAGGAVISQQGVAAAIGGFQQLGEHLSDNRAGPRRSEDSPATRGEGQKTIIIKLDKRELGRAVYDSFDESPVMRAVLMPRP